MISHPKNNLKFTLEDLNLGDPISRREYWENTVKPKTPPFLFEQAVRAAIRQHGSKKIEKIFDGSTDPVSFLYEIKSL